MATIQTTESRYNGTVRYLRRNYGRGHAHIVDGEKKVGVTTITGQFEKGGLAQWAANLAAETAIEFRTSKLTDAELLNLARFKHEEVKKDAAEGGTEAHDWIEKYLKNELLRTHFFESDKSIGIIEAYLEWEREYQPTNRIPEKNVISLEFDYCGTRDDRPVIGGVITTLDFKTGNPDAEYARRQINGKYRFMPTGKVRARDTHLMQDGGYDIADEEEIGERSGAFAVLYLPKEPKEFCKKIGIPYQPYFYFVTTNTEYWRARFLVARKYYDLSTKEYTLHPYQLTGEKQ